MVKKIRRSDGVLVDMDEEYFRSRPLGQELVCSNPSEERLRRLYAKGVLTEAEFLLNMRKCGYLKD